VKSSLPAGSRLLGRLHEESVGKFLPSCFKTEGGDRVDGHAHCIKIYHVCKKLSLLDGPTLMEGRLHFQHTKKHVYLIIIVIITWPGFPEEYFQNFVLLY